MKKQNCEYISTKTLAERMDWAKSTALNFVRSKEGKKYTVRLTDKAHYRFNWTRFQEELKYKTG